MLEKLETLRNSESGKALFYILIGFVAGLIFGVIISPKVVGSFNGMLSGNGFHQSGDR
ncbi:MAG: hypothetical protein ACI4KH_08090 [Oscillospiraceae bacterium]